ncbi:MAG: hypothetical protein Q9161_006450 [Pseudevernia consocians]
MQALQLTREGASAASLKLITTPKPIPGPGQVLIQIKASPIQPSDVLNSKGLFPHTTLPRIPGRDFAGIVVDGPSHLLGKEVFGTSGHDFSFTEDGCHAEYCLLSETAIVEKPKKLSFVQAASAGTPFTTAAIALRRAGVKAGETVLVLGVTGQVGSAVANLANLWGCKVLGIARGNAAEIDSAGDPTLSKAKALTNGNGPDVAVDTVGNAELAQAAIEVLGFRGRYSFISAPRGGNSKVPVDFLSVYRREVTLIGNNSVDHSQEEMTQELKSMCEGFESGVLVPMKESAMTFINLQEAIEGYADGKKRYVIRFD